MADLFNGSGLAVKRLICGATLQRHLALGTFPPTLLAVLGHELEVGDVAVTVTTPRQTVGLIPTINMALLRTVRRATPLEYAAMRRGNFTVEALHKEHLANRRMSDAELKRTILREGLDRVLALFDELTRPAGKTNGHADDLPVANDNANGDAAMPAQLSL